MKPKITFPHAGEYYIALSSLFNRLGFEVVAPPRTSRQTLDLGVKYAPSQACLPFKITLGNLIEGINEGANVVAMIGGKTGMCRLAYYSELYKKIIRDNGYKVEILNLKVKKEFWDGIKKYIPEIKFSTFLSSLSVFWMKLRLIEMIRDESLNIRPYEIESGSTTKVMNRLYRELEKANTRSELKYLKKEIKKSFIDIPVDRNKDVIKIGLVGEFFLLIDQFSTLNFEEFLGEIGVVIKSSLSLTDFFIGSIKQVRFVDNHFPTPQHQIKKMAKPFINRAIGGHGMQSIGNSIKYKKIGYDAVIHLYPFSCMPEIVASSILPEISNQYKLPILSLCLDEHTGEAGLQTRLEAFVDMIKRNRIVNHKI